MAKVINQQMHLWFAPFSSLNLAIDKSIKQVSWQYIDDFGGLSNTFENKIIVE